MNSRTTRAENSHLPFSKVRAIDSDSRRTFEGIGIALVGVGLIGLALWLAWYLL